MPKPNIITALDIGTSFIKLLSAVKDNQSEKFQVLYQNEKPSKGVRKGMVIEPEQTAEQISQLLQGAEQEAGQKIESVLVNIGGSHLFTLPAHGEIAVSRADQKISQEDIERVLVAAQTFSLPLNKEVLEVFPKEFIIDGEKGIKEPQGMKAVKLEVEILAVCAFSPYVKNITEAVLHADLQIDDLVPSALASSRAILFPKEKELGVALLDIGAGTSDLAVFEEDNLLHLATLPLGSAHITNDIAIGLKCDLGLAERIKKEFGACLAAKSKSSSRLYKIEQPGPDPALKFPQKMLVKIIEARTSEILEQTNKELKKISRQGLLPAGLVLTGGGSKLPGIVELAKKKLKLPVKIGSKCQRFIDLDQNIASSTLLGLALRSSELQEDQTFSWKKGFFNNLKKVFRIFIP